MMALGMVVIASMIGLQGLGANVLTAITPTAINYWVIAMV